MSSMPLLEDDTVEFGEEDLSGGTNTAALTHPYVTFFHVAFRSAAIIVYILCGWFSDSFITSFVTVVLLLSMDFWTVKNITGRLMVGLRWWNYVNDEGKSHWIYESRKGQLQNRINERESRIFWMGLILTQLIWSLFFIIALFGLKLKWLLLVMIAFMLNGSNLFGYIKCKLGNNTSVTSVTQDFFKKRMFSYAVDSVVKSTKQESPSGTSNSNPI